MKLDDSTEIKSVRLVNVDTGEETELFERKNRPCHFRETISFENYFIQLRLDWSDVRDGEPVLDADIWTECNDKKNSLRNGPWHHTEKKLNSKTNEIEYTFKFKNLELHLITKKTVAKTLSCDAILVKAELSVSKNGKKVFKKLNPKFFPFTLLPSSEF